MVDAPLSARLARLGLRAFLLGLLLIPTSLVFGTTQASLATSNASCGLNGTTWSCTWSGADASGTFTVPSNVTSLTVDAVGEAGSPGKKGLSIGGNPDDICFNIDGSPGGAGGQAAEVKGSITVTPGETLSVVAGSHTHALHGGTGGTANKLNVHDPNDCPPDPIYKGGGDGGNGGGASYVSHLVSNTTHYLAVAAGGGGGGGGGEATEPGYCSPGSKGGDQSSNGQGVILFHCTGDVDGGGGGTVGAGSDGNGIDGGSFPSFAGPLTGAGGAGGGGITGGGGGVDGATDGGGGGAGGSNLTPAGGTASTVSNSPAPKVTISYVDTSAPAASIQLSGTSNNGWYSTAVGVNVSFSDPDNGGPVVNDTADGRCVLDPVNAPGSFSFLPFGCSVTSVGSNGSHTIYAAGEDFAGNKGAVASATFKVDRTAPTSSVSLSPSSPDGSNGWYTGPVTPGATSSDNAGGSGVAKLQCELELVANFINSDYPCTQQVSDDGVWIFHAFSKDVAGNVESPDAEKTFKIDHSPPHDAPLFAGTTGTNGWWRSDVQVSWNWSDDEQGIRFDQISGIDTNNCPTGGSTSGEGTAVQLNGSCKDLAGNIGSDSKTFKVDKTAPTISVAPVPASPNGSNGWYTSNVAAHFTCGDSLSGVAGCPSDQTLSTEGSSVSSTAQTVDDNAGNTSSSSGTITVKIDKTAPSVSVTGVSDGAQYVYGNVPAAGCNTTDAVSGVATQATVKITGGTNGAGTFTATCSGAVDSAGNHAAPVAVSYTVLYAFGGYVTPRPDGTIPYKPGTATQVAFTLKNSQGQPISQSIAATLSGKLSATLTGQGITPATALCNWNQALARFQCNLTIPTLPQIGSSNPYQMTVYENLTGTSLVAPPFTDNPLDANPVTVYFKTP